MMPFFDDDEFFGDLLLMGAAAGGGSVVQETATGNPLTFQTDLARPLKSLLIPFTQQQEGSGDPSPENIRSILPWNGLTVFGGGKNLLDPSTLEQGGINADGLAVSNPKRIRTGYIPVKENTYYCLSAGSEYKAFMHFYDKDKGSIGGNTIAKAKAPAGACFVRGIIGYQEETNIVPADCTTGQIEVVAQSGQATAYEPYHPTTETDIVFPSPVYGGSAEIVSGAMMQTIFFVSAKWKDFEGNTAYTDTVRRDLVIPYACLYGSAGNGKTLCNVAKYKYNNDDDPHFYLTDAKRIRCFMPKDMDGETEITFACTLAEPIPLESIEPHQITALIGNNTIWSDADGSMTAVYLKKG